MTTLKDQLKRIALRCSDHETTDALDRLVARMPAVCRVCNGRRLIDGPSGHPEDAMICPACEEDEAEQRAEAPATAPVAPALPRMRSAFRTISSVGGDRPRYTMVFRFASLSDLHAADREWLEPGAPVVPHSERVQRLVDAVEGECDGLAISPEAAEAILLYVDTGEAPDDSLRGAAVVDHACTPTAVVDHGSQNVSDKPAAPVVPAGRLHTDGYFTWNRRDGYVLDQKLPCDFYLAAAAPQPPAAPAQTVPREKFDTLLADEHALSDAYVRMRQIIGAMDPPNVCDRSALWAYVEGVARERLTARQAVALTDWSFTRGSDGRIIVRPPVNGPGAIATWPVRSDGSHAGRVLHALANALLLAGITAGDTGGGNHG